MLSLATTPQEALRPIQSVPHFDSVERNWIASVHYLCDERFGGTSFYRHRSTGFESMVAQRLAGYAPCLKQEVMREAGRTAARSFTYIRGDTALFERTASVAAKSTAPSSTAATCCTSATSQPTRDCRRTRAGGA